MLSFRPREQPPEPAFGPREAQRLTDGVEARSDNHAGASVAEHVEACRAAIETALAGAGERAERLLESRVRLSIAIRGEPPGTGLTLALDGDAPEVLKGAGEAEIELGVTPVQLGALAAGQLALVAALLNGEVEHRGPLRPFLAVSPVLLALLREARDRPDAVVTPRLAAGAARDPGPVATNGSLEEVWAIECRGLRKRFGGEEILRGVDLNIPAGAISVVLGPSGTGKSVLLKHLIGLLRPDAGDVVVDGRPLGAMSLDELLALRRRCTMLFQDGALFGSMNVYDNVALPLRQHTDLSEEEIRMVVREHLGGLGIWDAANRMPAELSGGMRKRAGLARALVLDPEILLVDEPDSGLDPVRTALLCDLITQTHARRGGSYLVITHDITTTHQVADYIAVLWQGEVIEAGPAEQVLASDQPFVRQFLAGDVTGPLGMA